MGRYSNVCAIFRLWVCNMKSLEALKILSFVLAGLVTANSAYAISPEATTNAACHTTTNYGCGCSGDNENSCSSGGGTVLCQRKYADILCWDTTNPNHPDYGTCECFVFPKNIKEAKQFEQIFQLMQD